MFWQRYKLDLRGLAEGRSGYSFVVVATGFGEYACLYHFRALADPALSQQPPRLPRLQPTCGFRRRTSGAHPAHFALSLHRGAVTKSHFGRECGLREAHTSIAAGDVTLRPQAWAQVPVDSNSTRLKPASHQSYRSRRGLENAAELSALES
jgi:hypothetical protein